jgi:ZIP family zinc transporter
LDYTVAIALGLTLLAGLSTGLGSAIAFFFKRPKLSYLAFALGLSTGVMVYVSFMELLPTANRHIGALWSTVAFFLGILFIALIDLAVPHDTNPHDFAEEGELSAISTLGSGHATATEPALEAAECAPGGEPVVPCDEPVPAGATDAEAHAILKRRYERRSSLMRAGLFTALAIGIHNFPEGLATFATALSNVGVGVAIAIAIAIHNIPEGISVSVPIFYATGDRKKAFRLSFLSGLAEPAGALIGYLVLLPFLTHSLLASLMAFVAGIMVYISVDELLPLAHRYGRGHAVIVGIVLGMAVMASTILLLAPQ